jgi:hypothetical protein
LPRGALFAAKYFRYNHAHKSAYYLILWIGFIGTYAVSIVVLSWVPSMRIVSVKIRNMRNSIIYKDFSIIPLTLNSLPFHCNRGTTSTKRAQTILLIKKD